MSWKNRKRQFGLSGHGFLAKDVGDWWLAGGVSAASAVAVYQPIGADDLADSYVNLANPGTYNAAPGVAPTWDATNGWTFNGSTQYLDSGVLGGNEYSLIVMFSFSGSAQNGAMVGESSTSGSSTRLNIYPKYTDGKTYFRSGGNYSQPGFNDTSGIMCVTPSQAYINGSAVGVLSSHWTGSTSRTIVIGAHRVNSSVIEHFDGKIQAIAIYNTTLTTPQVAAITTEMQALP